MSRTTAILSLLHEPADNNSATRQFRERSALAWTIRRLGRCEAIDSTLILCHDDQREAVAEAAPDARVHSAPRTPVATLDQISAAQRWSDGWRGGLLGTCHFDLGFHAATIRAALTEEAGVGAGDLLLLIDPAAGLVDGALIDRVIAHASEHPNHDLFFTQAAPGLAGVVLRPALLERLAQSNAHPGRLLAYHPDTPGRDPITTDMCVPVAAPLARTTHRFTLDSARQVRRIERATAHLNGQLIGSDAETLLAALDESPAIDRAPREVVLEITVRRATKPIFSPATHLDLGRGDMPLETFVAILPQLREIDDLRLTLGGAGDPLLHPHIAEILKLLAEANVATHVETDLVDLSEEALNALATSRVDLLSIHLPAATPATYAEVMGVDAYAGVIANLKRLLTPRRTLPILIPTFTKCRVNLDEMEPWYDHWTRVLGAAVITGPSTFGGQIPDHAVADMSPPVRRACARLGRRVTILSDGTIASCENDVRATQRQGHSLTDRILPTWNTRFPSLRETHANLPLCESCKDWHRP